MTAAGLGYVAAVVVAAVFAAAGVAKLRDIAGTARDFDRLGLPNAELFARVIPLAELSVAVLVLVVPAGGAIAALVTLAFFSTFLVGRVRSGVDAPCACFGAASRAPLSWLDLVRNAGLMVLSAVALAADRPVRPTVADLVAVGVVTGAFVGGLHLLRTRRGATAGNR